LNIADRTEVGRQSLREFVSDVVGEIGEAIKEDQEFMAKRATFTLKK
jgi:hypothetical protein